MRHAPDPGQKIDTFDHEQARAHAAEARIKAGGRRSEPSMLSSWRGRPARSRNSRPEQESLDEAVREARLVRRYPDRDLSMGTASTWASATPWRRRSAGSARRPITSTTPSA